MERRIKISSIETACASVLGGFIPGTPITKINIAGCNLKCKYCDQKHHNQGWLMTVDDIISSVEQKQVVVTGGEPLLQQSKLGELFYLLGQNGHTVIVETNGTVVINKINCAGVFCWIVNYKLRGSRANNKNNPLPVYWMLPKNSWLNFVCLDWEDYIEARDILRFIKQNERSYTNFTYVISVAGDLDFVQVVEWLDDDDLLWVAAYEHR